ncbi:von Willebrand factor type A domain-containing protein [Mangrovivirga sp. M17]|uniref:von Willebrand factor type A domain-containing protein n=1 Tax=Mangrovivirga halotolerans TaxID=2993936 RepID=A0ABT3RMK5_9BACT|nr:von Willebrand factor type A domain-containing protein [Mangrovivirga halotolerans]MCX2743042.1 von Willebrand factor type A domain-containing protein [Mangrovivirga halotolerans]
MKKLIPFLNLFTIFFIMSCEESFNDFGSSMPVSYDQTAQGDRYNEVQENPFILVKDQPVSTFSIDADGASYSNVRRFLMQDNMIPPSGAIRTEEMINYFEFDYEFTAEGHPVSLNGEVSECPWNTDNKLIRIGMKGEPLPAELPPSNFVFLIDVSGSMASEDKLDLLKSGFIMLLDELSPNDRVAIVTYAGSSNLVLESTLAIEKEKIKNAISLLGAGGGTAGAEGIKTAYEIAQNNFIEGGNNRVILGTDGDFNVGVSSQDELVTLIEGKRDIGIFLTVLGVGRGNLNDGMMEQVANNGNGTYEYIDNVSQLLKVFVYDYGKFFTVAKDVKVQVEFNPLVVESYRLIGYENRLLNQEDFEDDTKDAGEIGANQNITALYEIKTLSNPEFRIVPTFTIDFRYKKPDEDVSVPLELEIFDEGNSFQEASDYMKFTSGVASFAMLLRNSQYKGNATFNDVNTWVNSTNLTDQHNFKEEFTLLVDKAKSLK